LIDPTGTTAGKYLDTDGNVVADDGIDDGKTHLVTDKKEAESLSKSYKGEKNVVQGQVKSSVELPSYEARASMSESVDRTLQPTGTSIEQGQDPYGNFHEEGGFYYEDANGKTIVVNAKPGEFAKPSNSGEASINVFGVDDVSKIPAEFRNAGTFHTHPGGVWNDDMDTPAKQGQSATINKSHFVQQPSARDIENAQNRGSFITGNSFVLAVGEKRVYIDNSKTVVGQKVPSLPLSTFRNFKP
jgi:hypothetical protein